jgi:hypothetical protein
MRLPFYQHRHHPLANHQDFSLLLVFFVPRVPPPLLQRCLHCPTPLNGEPLLRPSLWLWRNARRNQHLSKLPKLLLQPYSHSKQLRLQYTVTQCVLHRYVSVCASLSVNIISDSSFFHQIRTHQEKYQNLISGIFAIDTFPDKCLFSCIASALELDGATFSEDGTFTANNVRSIVADYIIEMKGNIYNHRTRKYEGSVSHEKFTKHVRKPRK